MNDITTFGHVSPGFGLTKAYQANVECLRVFGSVQACGLQQKVETCAPLVFVQSIPHETRALLYQNGKHIFSNRAIAFWVCESTKPQGDVIEFSEFFDEVWTASEFCAQVFRATQHKPVHVVPHYVSRFRSQPESTDKFTFLTMFDSGSRVARKNPFVILQAFKAAFTPKDKVRLVFKIKNISESVEQWIRNESRGYDVTIDSRLLSEDEMSDLYCKSHAYVSTHCGEGFGLPMLEAMAHSLPVIATGWSGNMEFMTHENSVPLTYTLASSHDSAFGGLWANVNFDHLVTAMQEMFYMPVRREELREAGFATALTFDFARTMTAMRERLQ
jgi:glycosyltransferase involved in cell wall biosynthesis